MRAVAAHDDGVRLGRTPVDPDHAVVHEPRAYAAPRRSRGLPGAHGLGRSGLSAYPAGVTATEALPHDLAAGETVLWRERRSPPFMEAAIAAAA